MINLEKMAEKYRDAGYETLMHECARILCSGRSPEENMGGM